MFVTGDEPQIFVAPKKYFARLNNQWLLIGLLLLFALVLNREGDHMPTGNEFIYLLYFYKAWHPAFLYSDWTFQEPTAGHAIFSNTLGWMTRIFSSPHSNNPVQSSLKISAWIGRVGCWLATYLGLFRVGRHFKISPWAIFAGIVLWLLQRQSPVTGEWMIGTFEAKVIAYPCLLFAVDAALRGRNILAGVLCGIAFSFHSAVGMWGGAALGTSILISNPIRKTAEFSLAAVVFSLPGLKTSWSLVMGKQAISLAEAKYLTTVSLPDCFDAAGFPHTWMALLLILPIFSLLHTRWCAEDKQVRQILIFELALMLFFVFGIVARMIGRFDWVELFPMRVYAVFAILFFFWRAMSVLIHLRNHQPIPRLLWAVGLLFFLCMPSPILQLRDMLGSHLIRYLHPVHDSDFSIKGRDADFIQAANWIYNNTSETDLVIAPPWRNDAYYYMQRPMIANWHAPRYNAMTEWKNRIELLVGDTSHLTYEDALLGEMDARAWAYYASLSPNDIQQIRGICGNAKWLISTGLYQYPIRFRTDTYRVYELP